MVLCLCSWLLHCANCISMHTNSVSCRFFNCLQQAGKLMSPLILYNFKFKLLNATMSLSHDIAIFPLLIYRSRNGCTWSCRKSTRCSLSPPGAASSSRHYAQWPTRASLSKGKAEKTSHKLYHTTTRRIGESIRKDKISWRIHERGASHEDQLDRGESTGEES